MALIRLMEEVIPSTWLIFSISSPLRFPAPRGVPGLVLSIDLHGEAIGDGSQAFR